MAAGWTTWAKVTFLTLFGLVLVYPIIWLVFSSFKPMEEIFSTIRLLPSKFVFDAYTEGWKGSGQFGFDLFFLNTFKLVIPTVVFTVLSSILVAYGFARFIFPLKKVLFAFMLATLMLPNAVIIIPKYILFRTFGWLDSYLTFIVPAIFATYPFFIYMMIQFFRGLPRELDESAYMDGCGSFRVLINLILPLSMPAVVSAVVLQFIWIWNDFLNSLIYINSVRNYTIPLALRMSLDTSSTANWNEVLAMTVLAIIPCMVVFFAAQRYFVEGIATTGLKG